MSSIDPAFMWETEALRQRRAGRTSPADAATEAGVAVVDDDDDGFVTLVEAHQATGIPVNTLRKWSRRGAIVSYLDSTGKKPIRMVSLEAVRDRATRLGREIAAPGERQGSAAEPEPDSGVTVDLTGGSAASVTHTVVAEPSEEVAKKVAGEPGPRIHALPATEPDAGVERPEAAEPVETETGSPTAAAPEAATETAPEREAPPGTMIIPISAWEKMLIQLGNLHEAGKEMAEARERAAKAETEAAFLRDRLKEMRTELEDARAATPQPRVARLESEGPRPPSPSPLIDESPARPPAGEPGPLETALRRIYRAIRRRLRGP